MSLSPALNGLKKKMLLGVTVHGTLHTQEVEQLDMQNGDSCHHRAGTDHWQFSPGHATSFRTCQKVILETMTQIEWQFKLVISWGTLSFWRYTIYLILRTLISVYIPIYSFFFFFRRVNPIYSCMFSTFPLEPLAY